MSRKMFDIGKSGSEHEITEALGTTTTSYGGVNRDLVLGAREAFLEGKPGNLQQILVQTYNGFSDKNIAARTLAHAITGEKDAPQLTSTQVISALEDFAPHLKALQDILNRAAYATVEKPLFAEKHDDEVNTIATLTSLKGAGADLGYHDNILLQVSCKKATDAVTDFIAQNGGDLAAAAASAERSRDFETAKNLLNLESRLSLKFLQAAYKDLNEQFRAATGHEPKPFPRQQESFEGPTRW